MSTYSSSILISETPPHRFPGTPNGRDSSLSGMSIIKSCTRQPNFSIRSSSFSPTSIQKCKINRRVSSKRKSHLQNAYYFRYEKPWVEGWKIGKGGKKNKFQGRTWDSIIFWSCITLGFVLGGLMCYFGFKSVVNYDVSQSFSQVLVRC